MPLKKESKLIQANIREVLSGKSSSYEQLYKVHAGRIYSFGLKFFNHNKESAEELTKRVFIKAYEQINSYPEDITFILWLKKLVVVELRKDDIEKPVETHKSSPADEAVFSLPEDERIIFILSDVEKLTIEEIVEVTGNSTDYINEKLELSRKKIMGKLKVKSLNELDSKVNFVSLKSEPGDELWKIIYSRVHSFATRNLKEESGGEIMNVGDAKVTLGEKFQRIKEEEKRKVIILKSLGINITLKAFFTFLIIILIAAVLWFLLFLNPVQWEVVNISGSPTIRTNYKNRIIDKTALLEKDESLSTNQNSKAAIIIPEVGDIYLNPGASVKRIDGKGDLLIINGEVKIIKKKESESFSVEVLAVKVEDYKEGSYSVKKGNKTAEIESESAGLIISSGDTVIYLLPGYICEIMSKGSIGLSYSLGASDEFIYAVNNFTLKKNSETLNLILLLSEKKDALTLFNLLRLVEKSSRDIVINKLQSFVRLPEGVIPRQMSNLNKEDLEKWLDAIEKIN